MRTQLQRSLAVGPAVALAWAGLAACSPVEKLPSYNSERELAPAIHLRETTYREEAIPIETTEHLSKVDFRSKVVVQFEPEKIQEVAGRFGRRENVLPAEPPAETEARQGAAELLEAARGYLALSESSEGAVRRFRETGAGDPAALESLVAQRAAAGQRILNAAMAAIVNYGRQQGWNTDKDEEGFFQEPFKSFRKQIEDRLLSDSKFLDIDTLALVLNQQFEMLLAQTQDDVQAARGAGALRFRVRAFLHKKDEEEPVPVHCKDYDNIQESEAPLKKAVSFNLSEKERNTLRERLRVVGDMARLVNDLRDEDSALRKSLRDLRGAIREDLRRLDERLAALLSAAWSAATLQEVLDFFGQAGASEAQRAALQKAVDGIDGLRAELRGLRERLRAFAFDEGPPDEVVAKVFLDGAATLAELQTAMSGLPAKAEAVLRGIQTAYKVLRNPGGTATAELAARGAQLLEKLGPESAGGVQEVLTTLARYPSALAGIRFAADAFLGKSDKLKLAASSLPGATPGDVLSRGLEDIVNTEISVNNLPADSGDRLALKVEIVEEGQDGNDRVVLSHNQQFLVERMGWYTKLDAHLIFVDRIKEPGGGVPRTQYEAAPSASWTLHYRMRPSPPDDWCKELYNFFDPGLGVNVAALQFENDGVEIGIGPHATLFNDLIQFGIGFNINSDQDREYFFLGIGLVETLNIASLGVQKVAASATGGN